MTAEDEDIVAASLLELKSGFNSDCICIVCKTSVSSYWRKDIGGRRLCNACGVYHSRRGFDRPVELWKKDSVT